MGGADSKVLIDIVNSTAAEVITKSISNCLVNAQQTQKVVIIGSDISGYDQTQRMTLDASCVSKFKMDTEIVAKIANKIQQKAEAQSVALLDLIAGSKAEANTKLRNIISAKITTELVHNCALNAIQSQDVYIQGSKIRNTGFSQDMNAVYNCMMNAIAKTGFATEIDNNTSQDAKAKQKNPLDIFGDIASTYATLIIIVVIAIVAGIVGIVWAIFA